MSGGRLNTSTVSARTKVPGNRTKPFRVDPFTIRRGLRSRSLTSKISLGKGVASNRTLGPRVTSKLAEFTFSGLALRITDRKSTRLNSSHVKISYAVFCLKKKKVNDNINQIEIERVRYNH